MKENKSIISACAGRFTLPRTLALLLAGMLLWTAAPAAHAEEISISGMWNFRMDPGEKGLTEQWFNQNLAGETMELPGSMPERGKGLDVSLKTLWTGSVYDSSYYYTPRFEKYRREGSIKIPFMLTPDKHYTGSAWYQRTVTVPASWKGQRITLFIERAHIQSDLWVDGKPSGSRNSLGTPHTYDLTGLTPGDHVITIRIDNSPYRTVNVGPNAHSVSDQTQGNWNGMVGRLELQADPLTYIDEVQVYPDLAAKQALVKVKVGNLTGKSFSGSIKLEAEAFNSDKQHTVKPVTASVKTADTLYVAEIVLPMGDNFLTWDEFSPALYRLTATLTVKKQKSVRTTQFGMREFTITGKHFFINGRMTSLRGTVENCLFPQTGYAPMDVASWKHVFEVAKSYGLNHFRFHSYCPPEAAFAAADLVGIYMQPEGPVWTTIGQGRPIDQYIMDESMRMEKYLGNHASYTMLTTGNEPSGGLQYMTDFVKFWKERDSRRVYCGASVGGSWPWQIGNQYHVRAGIRGLDWGRMPESQSDWTRQIDTVSIPFVTHEMGQWCVFPDFSEISKYTGVNKAHNFELFQEDLADQHMGDLGRQFMLASGKLQALCYKHEIEKSMRTANYGGFQLLCLNDYSGQGSALVGVTNVFWEDKGYISAEQWRRFCSETVPLMRTAKFEYKADETLAASVEMYHFGAAPISGARLHWALKDEAGKAVREGDFNALDIPIGNNIKVGDISLPLAQLAAPARYNLEISLPGTKVINDWDFWVYPAEVAQPENDIYFCTEIDAKAEKVLAEGGKVFLQAAGRIRYGADVKQQLTPVFWNTSWFKMRPPHTTGILVQENHPAFKDFPTSYYSDIHWWELVQNAQCILLTDMPDDFRPLVQPIDTWFINRRLGLIFEANVGKGRIMVSSADLQTNLDTRIVARQMLYSLTKYMMSDAFQPKGTVTIDNIKDLYTKDGTYVETYTKNAPVELRQGGGSGTGAGAGMMFNFGNMQRPANGAAAPAGARQGQMPQRTGQTPLRQGQGPAQAPARPAVQ